MGARYGGNQGTATLNGVTYDTGSWQAEVKGEHVVQRAGGDTRTQREPTFKDWNAEFQAFVPKSAVPNPFALVNTRVPFVGKITSGGTGYFLGTGLVESAQVDVQVDNQNVTLRIRINNDDGSSSGGPTITTASP